MTQPKTDLAYLRSEKAKAEQKLRACQHREKILERQMSELNRRERVHRLCTRAGMLESFLVCPGELTDDQVMQPGQKRHLALPIAAPTSSCWSLKRPSICCPSSNCSRKTGSSTIICRWAGCRARRCGSFSQNARTWSGCPSVWMPTKPERMPASGWRGCCRTR